MFDPSILASHLVFHFYDPTQRGRGTLGIRPLTWDNDNWPTIAP